MLSSYYRCLVLYSFFMSSPSQKKSSQKLLALHGTISDEEMVKKIVNKLLQYNARYHEITHIILSHSDRTFVDARLAFLESYYQELDSHKQSELKSYVGELLEHPEMIQFA